MKRTHPWILRSEECVRSSNRGDAQSNSCSLSCSPGPDEWIFFSYAVGTLPIEMSEKLFQGFITLCLFPCGKLQVAYLSWPLRTKPFMCVAARGEQESTVVWWCFCQTCSQSSSPSLPERRVGAPEVCRVTWYVARGSLEGSLVHILQWDPALLGPL